MALLVSEIYASLAGETSWAGLPCAFIRLTGCNLNCAWCDTAYARSGGNPITIRDAVHKVNKTGIKLVCVTGGEPLLQEETSFLITELLRSGLNVLVETNGSIPIKNIPEGAHRIVDAKTPGSGEVKSFMKDNLRFLRPRDELKFVVSSLKDFDWAARFVKRNRLAGRCGLLVSPAWVSKRKTSDERRFRRELADKVVASGLPFRYNIQLHKVIWGTNKKGV